MSWWKWWTTNEVKRGVEMPSVPRVHFRLQKRGASKNLELVFRIFKN